jgi:DNA-binding NtrC family response regulator
MLLEEHVHMTTETVHSILSADTGKPSPIERILIVDDEVATLFAYKKLIEREGIGVDVCESLDEAIEQIKSCRYTAIIADLRMSGTDNADGLEVLRRAREEQVDAKVIIVTGYGNKEIEQTALAMGAAFYFEKPVLPSAILKVLNALNSTTGDK